MKKNQFVFSRIILMVCLFAAVSQLQAQPFPSIPKKLQNSIKQNKLPEGITPPVALLKNDIELAAESINFSVVRVIDKFNARVKIEGVIHNVGRLNYTSAPDEQVALLYEENGGAWRLVASRPFQNLAVNATVKVSFTRSWNKSSPAEGEFPPNYILIVGLDPDIYIDGNNNNDDYNTANNKFTKSSAEINRMTFR
jgi:ABC-type antimicrobial peptide transport system permease subunit